MTSVHISNICARKLMFVCLMFVCNGLIPPLKITDSSSVDS